MKILLIKVLYVHDDEHKVLEAITNKSNWNTEGMLKLRNGSTMHKILNLRPIKQSLD